MRARLTAALGLLPLAAACWIDRPNLQSTEGGYTANASASRPAEANDHGAASAEEGPAENRPAPLSP